MTKETVFQGAATALVTPMNDSGVDYAAFGKLIDWQIDEGIDALVIAGTSGEGSTLSDKEHRAVMTYAAERIAGRVPWIAGTGSNDTAYAISLSRCACDLGADGLLVVTPYYNKTTQNGLIRMFETIADSVTKPLILYNVPSRTGINIEPETYAALADHPNITGIKEASGNLSKIVKTFSLIGDKLDLWSGNDDEVVPLMSLGGKGVISVLSNVAPRQTSEMCKRFFRGDTAGAARMQLDFLPLINALFCEVNPIPVKAAMAAMGFCENYVRLPLVPMEKAHEEQLLSLLRSHGFLS